MKNYANVCENEVSRMTKIGFLSRILHSDSELERILMSIKSRIISEIGALDSLEAGKMPDFSRQIELIKELYDTGFENEALTCLQIMELRIDELFPSLKSWLMLQKRQFNIIDPSTNKGVKQPIFIESFVENNNVFEVVYCLDGNQDDVNPEWQNIAFLSSDLLEFARQAGLNEVVFDNSNHLGEHIQQELKQPLFSHIQENIEVYIKNYLKAGWPIVKI